MTGVLNLRAGRICGFADLVRAECVTDVRSTTKTALVITAKGLILLEQNPASRSERGDVNRLRRRACIGNKDRKSRDLWHVVAGG